MAGAGWKGPRGTWIALRNLRATLFPLQSQVTSMKMIHRIPNFITVVFGCLLILVPFSPIFADSLLSQRNEIIKTMPASGLMAQKGDSYQTPGEEITERFRSPMYKGYRLDWCLSWAQDCGKGAADAWCQFKGYQVARQFQIAEDIGGSAPTKIISTGQMCTKDSCDGFKWIECYKRSCPAGPEENCCYGKEC